MGIESPIISKGWRVRNGRRGIEKKCEQNGDLPRFLEQLVKTTHKRVEDRIRARQICSLQAAQSAIDTTTYVIKKKDQYPEVPSNFFKGANLKGITLSTRLPVPDLMKAINSPPAAKSQTPVARPYRRNTLKTIRYEPFAKPKPTSVYEKMTTPSQWRLSRAQAAFTIPSITPRENRASKLRKTLAETRKSSVPNTPQVLQDLQLTPSSVKPGLKRSQITCKTDSKPVSSRKSNPMNHSTVIIPRC